MYWLNYDRFRLFSGPDKRCHCCVDGSSSLETHVRAKSSLTLQQSLGSFARIDVGPRGRDMDWSQVSQGQRRSPAPYYDYYLHCCSRHNAQHLTDINSPFPLWVIYSKQSPPPDKHTYTHACLIPFRSGWWRHKPAVFSLSLLLLW